MLASVLVVGAFVRLRAILSVHKELARKIEDMEKEYDKQFRIVFVAIKQLMGPAPEPDLKKKPFGFRANERK